MQISSRIGVVQAIGRLSHGLAVGNHPRLWRMGAQAPFPRTWWIYGLQACAQAREDGLREPSAPGVFALVRVMRSRALPKLPGLFWKNIQIALRVSYGKIGAWGGAGFDGGSAFGVLGWPGPSVVIEHSCHGSITTSAIAREVGL